MRATRGMTVIEILGVLAVMAAIFALAVPRIMQANREGDVRGFGQRLVTWTDAIEAARPGLDYTAFTMSSGVVPLAPAEWRTISGSLMHDFGGLAQGENRTVAGIANAGAALVTWQIPRESCRSALLQFHPRFPSVRVNGTWAKQSPATTLSAVTANSVCNQDRNQIYWVIL